MTNPQYQSGDTSNDVLSRLDAIRPQPSLNYWVIAKWPRGAGCSECSSHKYEPFYIWDRTDAALTRISIYSQRGESSEEIRLLYMNEIAYSTWKAMGKDPHVIGSQHRPPTTALLTFGVPFSD